MIRYSFSKEKINYCVTLFNSCNLFVNRKMITKKEKFSDKVNKKRQILMYSSNFLKPKEFYNLLSLDSKLCTFFKQKVYKLVLLKQKETGMKERLVIWGIILKTVFEYVIIMFFVESVEEEIFL